MSRRLQLGAWALGLAVLSGMAWTILIGLPGQVDDDRFTTKGVRDPLVRATIEEKRLKSRNDIRAAGAQLLAGLAVLGGGLLTWRTVQQTREGQLTDRFTKAVEHLGDDATPVRVGGIYALGRIARDSRADQGAVMALLADHLRAVVPWPPVESGEETDVLAAVPLPHPEVRAAARVLGERSESEVSRAPLDLSGIDFRSAPLSGAILRGCSFERSNLSGAVLAGAQLSDARFRDAILRDADLTGAQGVDLSSAMDATVRGLGAGAPGEPPDRPGPSQT